MHILKTIGAKMVFIRFLGRGKAQ